MKSLGDQNNQQVQVARDWLEYDLQLKKSYNVSMDFKVGQIKLQDVLESIDESLTKYYKDNYSRAEIEENFGVDLKGFFYFTKKRQGGYYKYHLFPKINLELIENKNLMKNNLEDISRLRMKYIKDIIENLNYFDVNRKQTNSLKTKKLFAGSLFQKLSKNNPQNEQKDKTKSIGDKDENNPIEMKKVYLIWIHMWCVMFNY